MKKIVIFLFLLQIAKAQAPAYLAGQINQKLFGASFFTTPDTNKILGMTFLGYSDRRPSGVVVINSMDEPFSWWTETRRYTTVYSFMLMAGIIVKRSIYFYGNLGYNSASQIIQYHSQASGIDFYMNAKDSPISRNEIPAFAWGLGVGSFDDDLLLGFSYHNWGRLGVFIAFALPMPKKRK